MPQPPKPDPPPLPPAHRHPSSCPARRVTLCTCGGLQSWVEAVVQAALIAGRIKLGPGQGGA